MFQMAADGLSVYRIARKLTQEQVLIPTMYKYQTLGYKTNQFDEN